MEMIPWNDHQGASVSSPPGRAGQSRDKIVSNMLRQPAR